MCKEAWMITICFVSVYYGMLVLTKIKQELCWNIAYFAITAVTIDVKKAISIFFFSFLIATK